jgi:uncharacterized protein (TIGR03435 family)
MRKTIYRASVLALACAAAYGQPSPQFEVATVKPDPPSADGRIRVMLRGGPGTNDPGRINYEGVTLKDLLSTAYAVKNFQVQGPAWLDTERFNVVAKVPEGTTKEQFNVMLQNLLTERLQVGLHHEQRDFSIYELSVAKNGAKLKAAVEDPNAADAGAPGPPAPGRGGFPQLPPGRPGMGMSMGRGMARVSARVQPVSQLAVLLGNQLNSLVIDKTGLAGTYDFNLEFAPTTGLGGLPALPPPAPTGETQPAHDQPR